MLPEYGSKLFDLVDNPTDPSLANANNHGKRWRNSTMGNHASELTE